MKKKFILTAEGVSKSFDGFKAINDLNFYLDEGELRTMIGPNGAGKSTFLDLITGVLAQFHDAFTIKHTRTGFEVHGTEGSLIGEDVMTQEPRGHVFLQREDRREEVNLGSHENLYVHQVRHFNDAAHGRGVPFATAEDGIRSLAVATAVVESARSGQRVPVSYSIGNENRAPFPN